MLMGQPIHLLVVCGRNKRRSSTAEQLYFRDPRCRIRSAGLSQSSPHIISMADIEWADLILVMEDDHRRHLRQKFNPALWAPVEVLHIPDEYDYMDPELVDMLKTSIENILDQT